jgi:endonuclease YncB( thermonuclease family)
MHNFKDFPELTNAQMPYYYWESPHKQIFDPFTARVIRVHDGDTIIVRCDFRDFDFSVRLPNASARELIEKPERDTSAQLCADGQSAQRWLENRILGRDVQITPTISRVEKWGRLLANVMFQGVDLGTELAWQGQAVPWERRMDGKIPMLKEVKI